MNERPGGVEMIIDECVRGGVRATDNSKNLFILLQTWQHTHTQEFPVLKTAPISINSVTLTK